MKEGFLCPLCMKDLGDLIQLQLHFEEKHSKDGDFVQNLKDLFGKAKKKILVASEDESFQALVSELSLGEPSYGSKPLDYHPVSGIHYNLSENETDVNKIQVVSHFEYFRTERSKRADMKAMDTNKLILRLERLMTSLPSDPVKRRAHEQSIVTWLPEEDVKLCPNCARSFNITRRKHHCRLCGAVMCADCSTTVSFNLANRVIHPATIAKYSPEKDDNKLDPKPSKSRNNTPRKGYDHLMSNLVDLAGFTESQSHFRSCCYCREVLERRDALVRMATQPPTKLVLFYNQLHKFMNEGKAMSKRYCEMAEALNAGEATQDQLSESKILRMKLLKMAEIVDATSKKILSLEIEGDEDESVVETLKNRIRASAVNYVKDTLVGLPSVPSEEELEKLKANRKKEAERKIAEEKAKAHEAKLRYEHQQIQQQMARESSFSFTPTSNADHPVKKFLSPSASSNNLEAVKSQLSNAVDGLRQKAALVPKKSLFGSQPTPNRDRPVTFGRGFVATASEDGGPDLDPLVQQMQNLRQFISQARSAGKLDDAKLLEQNLRDLQEEYQKLQERRELEDNYIHFKSVFGTKSPSKQPQNGNQEEELDESNPFFDENSENLNESSNPFSEHDNERDEFYEDSGKNPFF